MKTCILLLSLIATFAASAQTQKGHWLVGSELASADASFYTGNNELLDNIGISLHPRAGYFVRDNFAIGARLTLAASFGSGSASYSLGVQPFARKYFGKKQVKILGEAGAGYVHHISTGSSNGTQHYKYVTAHLGPGLAYFITPNIALESSLLLQAATRVEGLWVNYSPRISMGFLVYLQKNMKREGQETEN